MNSKSSSPTHAVGAGTNESYVVLARKYRSAQFSDVVGQSHIVRTLMSAIRAGRVHHAYLFTGSRGIGKTSIARIFAKVLRCENTTSSEDGWLRSCDACPSCREITGGTGVDVIEIDGASNNGVEAVREIRENAKYLPSTGSKKIYIIDEVHMLTTAAFNALLKTLEEPPAHVIFIFATTEPHKIPATILSRVQRFDYRRHTLAQIQAHLVEITKAEKLEAETGALAMIARAAGGSMRDSLSLLDQVIAFSGNRITVQSARESIGLIEGQAILGIIRAIFVKKPLDALAIINQAYQQGHDLRVLTRSLIEFLHAAILAKIGSENGGDLELSNEEWSELKTVSELRSLEEIELIFQVLHHGLEWIARSPQPKIVLDVLTVKCATADALITLDAGGSSGGGEKQPGASTAEFAKPAVAKPAMRLEQSQNVQAVETSAPIASSPAPMSAPVPPPVSVSVQAPAPRFEAAPPKPVVFETPSSEPPPGERTWEGLISEARKTRPLLATILEHGSYIAFPSNLQGGDSELVICFPPADAYFREQLQARAYHDQLIAMTRTYFGRPVRIQLELREAGESLAARKEREIQEKQRAAKDAARNHPIILEAKALFGGELGPIELSETEAPRANA